MTICHPLGDTPSYPWVTRAIGVRGGEEKGEEGGSQINFAKNRSTRLINRNIEHSFCTLDIELKCKNERKKILACGSKHNKRYDSTGLLSDK
jgi:hypothetical protein